MQNVGEYNAFEPGPLTFIVLPVLLAWALAWGTVVAWRRSGAPANEARRAGTLSLIAALAWMAATWIAAASGVLRQWDRNPPPFGILVISIVAIAFGMSFSRFGSRLATGIPLSALIFVQAFRFPLELAMHGMYTRGIMPLQMTYTGLNFDIITGIAAIPVAIFSARGTSGRGVVTTWNIVGLALLVNVVTVAILHAAFSIFRRRAPECLGDVSAVRLAARGDGAGGTCRSPAHFPSACRPTAWRPA